MRTSELNVTVNVATVAKILAKETSLSHGQALNVVAKACGREDIGSLLSSKASEQPLHDKVRHQASVQSNQQFLFVRFAVVNGSFEDIHRAVLVQRDDESVEDLQRRAMQYALFFYDDLSDYADDLGLQPEEIDECLDRCIAEYESSGSFNNAGGELTIKDIHIQEVGVDQYNAFQMIYGI